ncbi:uncharacterized protein V6R79_023171 [Siganus canaliculatus]
MSAAAAVADSAVRLSSILDEKMFTVAFKSTVYRCDAGRIQTLLLSSHQTVHDCGLLSQAQSYTEPRHFQCSSGHRQEIALIMRGCVGRIIFGKAFGEDVLRKGALEIVGLLPCPQKYAATAAQVTWRLESLPTAGTSAAALRAASRAQHDICSVCIQYQKYVGHPGLDIHQLLIGFLRFHKYCKYKLEIIKYNCGIYLKRINLSLIHIQCFKNVKVQIPQHQHANMTYYDAEHILIIHVRQQKRCPAGHSHCMCVSNIPSPDTSCTAAGERANFNYSEPYITVIAVKMNHHSQLVD